MWIFCKIEQGVRSKSMKGIKGITSIWSIERCFNLLFFGNIKPMSSRIETQFVNEGCNL